MRTFIKVMSKTLVVLALVGCGATAKEIAQMSRSESSVIFTEITEQGTAPAGYVDLLIRASLKSPLAGYYLLEPARTYEQQGYPFLVNIDGQAILWKVLGQKETIPLYDEKGRASHDPDAGPGIKYNLEKKIRIAAGRHKIFFALPEEGYSFEVAVTLKEGAAPVLEFKPQYRYKTNPTRISTFRRGISRYEPKLTEGLLLDRAPRSS